MTPAARLSAAIELIEAIDTQRIPAAKALKEWGTAHRFAGSGDRAAISGLIWDVLRRQSSAAYLMDDDSARVAGALEQGQRVVALGAQLLHEGEQVRVASQPVAMASEGDGRE